MRDEPAAGRLVRMLPGWQASDSEFDRGICAVFRQAALLPAKARALMDSPVEALPGVVSGSARICLHHGIAGP